MSEPTMTNEAVSDRRASFPARQRRRWRTGNNTVGRSETQSQAPAIDAFQPINVG